MAQILYKFIKDGENKKIEFRDDTDAELFVISCDEDINFDELVKYLIKKMDDGQEITYNLVENFEYSIGPKEELIKTTIEDIIVKFNETVNRKEIAPEDIPENEYEEDSDVKIVEDDGQIPF